MRQTCTWLLTLCAVAAAAAAEPTALDAAHAQVAVETIAWLRQQHVNETIISGVEPWQRALQLETSDPAAAMQALEEALRHDALGEWVAGPTSRNLPLRLHARLAERNGRPDIALRSLLVLEAIEGASVDMAAAVLRLRCGDDTAAALRHAALAAPTSPVYLSAATALWMHWASSEQAKARTRQGIDDAAQPAPAAVLETLAGSELIALLGKGVATEAGTALVASSIRDLQPHNAGGACGQVLCHLRALLLRQWNEAKQAWATSAAVRRQAVLMAALLSTVDGADPAVCAWLRTTINSPGAPALVDERRLWLRLVAAVRNVGQTADDGFLADGLLSTEENECLAVNLKAVQMSLQPPPRPPAP